MFWTVGVGGLLIGVIGLTIKYIYKIKCSDCTFCFGCIKCVRNVDVEIVGDAIPTPQANDSPTPTIDGRPRSITVPTNPPSRINDIFSRV
jgi:hypothetical protein